MTFYHQEYAPNGVYHLKQTFFEAEDGKDQTFESTGTWNTLETDSHPIYVITDYADGSVNYFSDRGETIEMLDQDMNPIESEFDYTLVRRLQDVKAE